MRAIKVHEFITLDGVIDAPAGGFEFGFDPAMGQAIAAVMSDCDGVLLGRNAYQMFEPAWSTRTAQDDPGAPFMNDTQKYVVSSTLTEPTWRNSTLLGGYDPDAIRELEAAGPRLFTDAMPQTGWSLADSQRYDNGVVYLNYALRA